MLRLYIDINVSFHFFFWTTHAAAAIPVNCDRIQCIYTDVFTLPVFSCCVVNTLFATTLKTVIISKKVFTFSFTIEKNLN